MEQMLQRLSPRLVAISLDLVSLVQLQKLDWLVTLSGVTHLQINNRLRLRGNSVVSQIPAKSIQLTLLRNLMPNVRKLHFVSSHHIKFAQWFLSWPSLTTLHLSRQRAYVSDDNLIEAVRKKRNKRQRRILFKKKRAAAFEYFSSFASSYHLPQLPLLTSLQRISDHQTVINSFSQLCPLTRLSCLKQLALYRVYRESLLYPLVLQFSSSLQSLSNCVPFCPLPELKKLRLLNPESGALGTMAPFCPNLQSLHCTTYIK